MKPYPRRSERFAVGDCHASTVDLTSDGDRGFETSSDGRFQFLSAPLAASLPQRRGGAPGAATLPNAASGFDSPSPFCRVPVDVIVDFPRSN